MKDEATGPPFLESSPPSDHAPVSYASVSSSTSHPKPALSISANLDSFDTPPDKPYDKPPHQRSMPTGQPQFFVPDYVYYPSPLVPASDLDHPYPSPMSPYFSYSQPSPSTPDGFRYGSPLMSATGGGVDWTTAFPPLMGSNGLGGGLGLVSYSTYDAPGSPAYWLSQQPGSLTPRRSSNGLGMGKNGGVCLCSLSSTCIQSNRLHYLGHPKASKDVGSAFTSICLLPYVTRFTLPPFSKRIPFVPVDEQRFSSVHDPFSSEPIRP